MPKRHLKLLHRNAGERRPVLITGGAGFIGTNLAHRLLTGGAAVIILDNLSQAGVERNLRWLRAQHQTRLHVVVADVRDEKAVAGAVRQCGQVYHLAAQVGDARSLIDPVSDFEVNTRGTLNVLEAVRQQQRPIPFLFTSTHQVYGALPDLALNVTETRYAAPGASAVADGISEARAIECHTPYGCSKGAAERYALGYARTYGLPATVFRLSCILGPHQGGIEEQGWIAQFLLRALRREPITLHGDGRQVRDLLFVDDLVDAMLFAQANTEAVQGRPFNLGGGPANTISLLELIALITELNGEPPQVVHADACAADQRYYVSDIRRYCATTGWKPRVGVREGIRRLHRWLIEHRVAEAETDTLPPPSPREAEGYDIELSVTRSL